MAENNTIEINAVDMTAAENALNGQTVLEDTVSDVKLDEEQTKALELIKEKVAEAYGEGYKQGAGDIAHSMKDACVQMGNALIDISHKLEDVIAECEKKDV